jgi:glycosyltransferase involved in cell wall biosynthesis
MNKRPSITAFYPAYNDAGTIASMVVAVVKTLEEVTDDYEVIVVENGSTDYTLEVLEELAKRYERLRVLVYRDPLGYGGALRAGFANATRELIFYTDGDAQYDPRELRLLLSAMRDDVDIVNGWKIDRGDPIHRIIIGRVYHHFVKFMFGFKLRDVDCDFRLIRREIFDTVDLHSDSGTICLEMVKKIQDAGYRFAEVPVHHYHRTYGKSQFFNFPRLWRTGIQLIALWWRLVVFRTHRKNTKKP